MVVNTSLRKVSQPLGNIFKRQFELHLKKYQHLIFGMYIYAAFISNDVIAIVLFRMIVGVFYSCSNLLYPFIKPSHLKLHE